MASNHEINKLELDKSECKRKIQDAINQNKIIEQNSHDWRLNEENIKRLKDEFKQINEKIAILNSKLKSKAELDELESTNEKPTQDDEKNQTKDSTANKENVQNKVDIRTIFFTEVPDFIYSTDINSSSKPNCSSTTISDKMFCGSCKKLEKLNIDIEKEFDQSIAEYGNEKRHTPFKIEQREINVSKENEMSGYLRESVFNKVTTYLKSIDGNTIIKPLTIGEPDFVIGYQKNDEIAILPIELKLDQKMILAIDQSDATTLNAQHNIDSTKKPQPNSDATLINFFNSCQTNKIHNRKSFRKCTDFACCAIQQIYTYMIRNNSEYGILSTFERTWILKRENEIDILLISDCFFTSPSSQMFNYGKSDPLFLKIIFVVFSLMKNSKKSFQSFDESKYLNPNGSNDFNDSNSSDGSDLDFNTRDRNISKSNRSYNLRSSSKKRKAHDSQNIDSNNLLTPPDSTSPISKQKPSSMRISFQIESFYLGSTIIGTGRSGTVCSGFFNGIKVAIKFADVSKLKEYEREDIISEMKNEGKVLSLLNKKGYPHAPKLYYSGHHACRYFYLNITQLIEGRHKKTSELSENEREHLNSAIEKLHELHIVHNDLKSSNIIFCENGSVFIIDYCFSKILPKSHPVPSNHDEENFKLKI